MRRIDESVAEKVLDYWFTLEFLGQDKYPEVWSIQNKINALKREVSGKTAKKKMIWDFVELKGTEDIYEIVKNEAHTCGMNTWGNLTFYIGRIKREACIECIARSLPDEDEEGRPEKNVDKIACASLQLSAEGKYVEHTLSLSTIVWAMNEIKNCEGKIADYISEKQYRAEVEELEQRFFGRYMEGNGGEDAPKPEQDKKKQESIPEKKQISTVETVTLNTLKELYREIEKRYIKGNIAAAEETDVFEEIYGMSFQIFRDEAVKNKEDDENYLGLSHDFYSDDIKLLLENLKNGELENNNYLGQDIIRYICVPNDEDEREKSGRINLVNPKEQGREQFLAQLSEILSVSSAPLGKWPSRFMPAFMQQMAINLAVGKGTSRLYEADGRMFSVNGPPGTGKTTLLKEIVVNNIVERAILLSAYDKPDEAFEEHEFQFGDKKGNAYSKYIRHWYTLKNDEINNYSVLIASCNNAAVENISKELPIQTGILGDLRPFEDDPEELKEMLLEVGRLFEVEHSPVLESNKSESYKDIYFTEYACELLGNQDAWGLIAAPLGKKSNINEFYNKVLNPLHWDFYPNGEAARNREEQYKKVRKLFSDQLERVKQLQKELECICRVAGKRIETAIEVKHITSTVSRQLEEGWKTISELKQREELLQRELSEKAEALEKARQEEQKAQMACVQAETVYEETSAAVKAFYEKELTARGSVGIFTKFFYKSKYLAAVNLADEYKNGAEAAKAQMEEVQSRKAICRESLKYAENRTREAVKAKDAVDNQRSVLIEEIEKQQGRIYVLEAKKSKAENGFAYITEEYQRRITEFTKAESLDTGCVLDEEFVQSLLSEDADTATKAQVANPWFTQRYNREREKLFYYAMRLNKEFVLSSNHCRNNFITLSQYWGLETGDDKERISFDRRDRERFAGALYQTLFLLVPVISSTFASVGTFMKDIKQSGVIGTLIVDEAGQAQPQMALGALYRSRRAVIVGDPKQVEPVVTDDLNLLKKTFHEEYIKPYKAKNLSVQGFADQLNAFGTYLDNGTDEPDWVGCPLLVHRRCISPMYDISNEISYNNMMRQQTRGPKPELCSKFVYEKSQWINIKGREKGNKNHFVEAQGQKVCEILETAFEKEDRPNLYIISPFTSVVSEMRSYLRAYCRKNAESPVKKGLSEWVGKHIGTVHTFQGKEADEVIFLLGCDTSREAQGAVKWVNSNIVNVAVTRAKYRLYVIGDEAAWKQSPCVRMAKKIIDNFAIIAIQEIMDKKLPKEEERKALAAASTALPSVTSFSADEIINENGEIDYSVDTTGFLAGLNKNFMKAELSEEQREKFGFDTIESLEQLPMEVKKNLLLGIKLFYLLRPAYAANPDLDASCCAILFCKAMELQMKECFTDSMKERFPDFKVNGFGRGMICLKEADKKDLTLGAFDTIISKKTRELGTYMKEHGQGAYNTDWWNAFEEKLRKCKNRRNQCCHSGRFSWKDQSFLLFDLFKDGNSQNSDNKKTKIGGLMFESKAGKMINRKDIQ